MAEQNNNHEIQVERKLLEVHGAELERGMWIGAGLFFLLIAAAFALPLITGNLWTSVPFLGTAAIGGVTAFIGRKRSSD